MSPVSIDRQALHSSRRGLTSLADVVSVTEWKQLYVVIGARDNTSFLWKWLLFVGLVPPEVRMLSSRHKRTLSQQYFGVTERDTCCMYCI
jgi:hypothetical protein